MKRIAKYMLGLYSIMLSSYMVGASNVSTKKFYFYHTLRTTSGMLLFRYHQHVWLGALFNEIIKGIRATPGLMSDLYNTKSTLTSGSSGTSSWSSMDSSPKTSSTLSSSRKSVNSGQPYTAPISQPTQPINWFKVVQNTPDALNESLNGIGKGFAEFSSDIIKTVGGFVMKHGGIQLAVFLWSHYKLKQMEKNNKPSL